MRRREFLAATAAATMSGNLLAPRRAAGAPADARHIYASPAEAMRSPHQLHSAPITAFLL